ncbi:hypothetical protein [Parasitella parasitica]|uniref:Uncharacterized protein n=1 Tax=Parasitella parasitica TaxID=35722 RepID=A0A0B7N0L1_9FUNG|nr:hypothetical protein [Parasitella parasitica]
MDLTVDEELFAIQTISSCTQFHQNKPPERPLQPALHPVGDERNHADIYMELCNKRRCTFYFDKSLSTSAAATQLGIHVRAFFQRSVAMTTTEKNNQYEYEMTNDLLTFKLPPDQLPRMDTISKSILKTSNVINIITLDLLNVPKGTYTTAKTEWDNGSRSDILFVP